LLYKKQRNIKISILFQIVTLNKNGFQFLPDNNDKKSILVKNSMKIMQKQGHFSSNQVFFSSKQVLFSIKQT